MTGRRANLVNDYVCGCIRTLRIEKGLRVRDMAERTSIPLGSYSCLETGRYRMSLENLFKILHALGVEVTEVWPGKVQGQAEKVDAQFVEEKIRTAIKLRPVQISLDDVLDVVCRTYEITVEEVSSPSRQRDLAEARTVATILVREIRHLSLAGLSRRRWRPMFGKGEC